MLPRLKASSDPRTKGVPTNNQRGRGSSKTDHSLLNLFSYLIMKWIFLGRKNNFIDGYIRLPFGYFGWRQLLCPLQRALARSRDIALGKKNSESNSYQLVCWHWRISACGCDFSIFWICHFRLFIHLPKFIILPKVHRSGNWYLLIIKALNIFQNLLRRHL